MLEAYSKRKLVRVLKAKGLTGFAIVRRGARVIAYSPQEMALASKDVVTSDNIRSRMFAVEPILDRNPYKLWDGNNRRFPGEIRLPRRAVASFYNA